MKTQILQLVKINNSDIYDNIIPNTMILIKSDYDEMKFIVSSSFQKEEIHSEDIFDTINNQFLDKLSNENDISPKLYRSLIRSIIDEDEDGMYDWIEENGGEVSFIYPNQGQNHLGDTDFEDNYDCIGIISFDIDDNNIKIEEDMNYNIEMEKVILYQEDW